MFTRLFARLLVTSISKSPDEIQAIQRHRYSILSTELMQDRDGYDHAKQMLHLEMDDDEAAFHAYVGPANNPTASVLGRVYDQSEVPAADVATYDLDRLPDLKGFRVGFLSHLVVSRGARGSMSAVSVISGAIEELVRERHCGVVYIDCKPGLVQSYRKMGLRTYGAPIIHCIEGVLVPMMAISGDIKWLRSISSPLYPTLKRLHSDGFTLPAAVVSGLIALCDEDHSIVVDPIEIAENLEDALVNQTTHSPPLPAQIRERLVKSGFVLNLHDGTELVRTGASDREMYLILDGALVVSNAGIPFAVCRVGELVGEVAFFWGEGRRSASMYAQGPTKVLVIRRNFVNRLKDSDPRLAADFLQYAASILASRFATMLEAP